jgi:hypothetical protein
MAIQFYPILLTILSIYIMERKGTKRKYVDIFTHRHVGSIGAFLYAFSDATREHEDIECSVCVC